MYLCNYYSTLLLKQPEYFQCVVILGSEINLDVRCFNRMIPIIFY